jgi:hypothetical protein
MIFLFLVLNFVISIFNAWGVGRSWVETKVVGGLPRFMAWMGATMSAVGFTWCYLVILAFFAGPEGFNKIPANYVDAMFSLGYLIIIFPCLGSGIAITIDSWAYFWRKRTIGSGALAAYNTFADLYNIYEAARFVPKAWGTVIDLLNPKKRDKSSSSFAGIAITLALAAVLGGILTTAAIVRTVSERTASDRKFRAVTES